MEVSDQLQELRDEVRLLREAVSALAPMDQTPPKGQLSLTSVLEDLDERASVQVGSPENIEALEEDFGASLSENNGTAVLLAGLVRGHATSRWYRTEIWPRSESMPRPDLATLLEPLSHQNRVALLFELSEGPRTTGDLQEETGMGGGQFYHHLNKLIDAGFVSRLQQGKFCISSMGRMILGTLVTLFGILDQWPLEEGVQRARETASDSPEAPQTGADE